MSEESGEVVVIDVKDEIKRSESIWKLFHGHIGAGKTLYMTGELFTTLKEHPDVTLIITNYTLLGIPSTVEIFKSSSVRKIMERLILNYDPIAMAPKNKVILAIDEINNTLSSKQAASNVSTWMTTIASHARRYGVVAFLFSTQGRKQSDYRLRVNCSFAITPTGKCDIDQHPTAYWWEDMEIWDMDIHRGGGRYEEAVLVPSIFTLEFLQRSYNTTELVPIDLNPSVKEDEIDEVMGLFLGWCGKKGIVLEEFKRTDVKDFIKRWNNDKSVNVIPYSPAGEQVIFSECVLRGYVEPKKKEEFEIAEEPEEPEIDKKELEKELLKDPLFERAYKAELISPGASKEVIDDASQDERDHAGRHLGKVIQEAVESTRRLVKCNHCGHEQMTKSKVPVCSKCHKSVNGGQPDTVSNVGSKPD